MTVARLGGGRYRHRPPTGAAPAPPPPPAAVYKIWSRIAGMMIGGTSASFWSNAANQQQVARTGLTIMGVAHNSYSTQGLRDMLDEIYALHNAQYQHPLLLAPYTNIVECPGTTVDGESRHDVRVKLDATNWWLRTAAGARVESNIYSPPGNPRYDTNILNAYTTPDSGGLRLPQWMAQRDTDLFYSRVNTGGVTRFPIAYFDNSNRKARSDPANWRLNGVDVTNSESALMVEFREAMAVWWATIESLNPGIEVYGNPDPHQTNANLSALAHAEYQGKLHGGFMENAVDFNSTSSPDSTGGWTRLMSRLDSYLTNLKGPKRATLAARGSVTFWRQMRYALCSTLMRDNAYFCYNATGNYTSVPAFDEYDLPLGTAIEDMQTQGNFRYRRYTECMAVVHTTTTTETFDVSSVPGGPWKTFAGTQDSAWNNNQTITSRSFAGKEGLILIPA